MTTEYARNLNDAIEFLQAAAELSPKDKDRIDAIIDQIMTLESAESAIERRLNEERF